MTTKYRIMNAKETLLAILNSDDKAGVGRK